MKNHIKIMWVAVLFTILFACKQGPESAENSSMQDQMESVESASNLSSSAAKVDKNSSRKFIRTADVKFKVKSVAKTTYAIEDATSKFGGYVTYTNLESNIYSENQTKISPDSTLVSTKYKVENNITIRVPNTKLDTLLKTISKQIHFLNYRVIKADDVSLTMLSNEMAQKRSHLSEKRLENAIDNKGKKLKNITDAEENLTDKKEQNDAAKIQNLSLKDQVDFSTITLNIYQDESITQEMVANEKSINSYRPNIGLQLLDSLKTGWFMLENIISFIVLIWPILLFGFLGYFGYKRLKTKKE
ncbi:DUF4349 domain-containing protein [Flavobacterium antarcticum]|uniref:DUF4349 domain-containing protein n=1 Tax=Flavobacterium antarcticum TaxID=271155 RepID=UPI000400DD0F|nr:DUF4349 domain-containing protein [Flavobacterium antarcticum]